MQFLLSFPVSPHVLVASCISFFWYDKTTVYSGQRSPCILKVYNSEVMSWGNYTTDTAMEHTHLWDGKLISEVNCKVTTSKGNTCKDLAL